MPCRRNNLDQSKSSVKQKELLHHGLTLEVPELLSASKNETIIEKAKIAAMKKNYIIDPKAIEQTLNFWKEVGNKVMAKAEFNKTNCERLPINDVSPAMFTMMDTDNEEAETELDGSSHEIAEKREHSSGGSSLLRTFPDLLSFGRGETGKTRRIKISRKALLAYMLNLSPRQFQEVDFVLPMYDMEQWGTDGTLSTKAEAFGQISVEDMKKFGEHKINCAKTASKGGILPPPPVSLGGVAAEFFNDIMVATKHNQHSMAAAAENRANLPVAGALNYERCLNIAIEYVVGWDCEANAALKNRGVWGTPSRHLRIVEEQFRLTLHSHNLNWFHGHQQIETQLKAAKRLSATSIPIN
ncbi:Uncharacterized protein APZ42_025088 [Daphnia magna]|uniref:Uncharacterized protein n=1 Tax=Daphnia magna TaxID=35525 RepID=A0A164TGB7_9CRUS|nr:Uncharacterized protein APZ42_025088 [Daphnia magna]